jgi:hypothetical protein
MLLAAAKPKQVGQSFGHALEKGVLVGLLAL